MILSSTVISKVFGKSIEGSTPVGKVVDNFEKFLEENHLINLLPNIIKHLELEAANLNRKNKIKITTSHKFSEDTLKKIMTKFDFDEKEDCEVIIDENIIGGFIVEGKNRTLDASFGQNLSLLKESLLKK